MKQREIVFILGLFALLALPHSPADAQGGRDGLRDRAACASINLAIAVGDQVSDADRARCGTASRKVSPTPPKNPAASAPQLKRPPARKPQSVRPDWTERPPQSEGILYGVGSGPSAQEAFAKAVSMVGAQIKVTIKSELRVDMEESTTTDSRGKERTTGRENISSTTRMLVHGVLEDVVFEDQYVDKTEGVTWVLASLNVAAIRAKEQAVLNAVLSSLSQASERLVQRMQGEGVFDQGAMGDVIDVLIETIAMGKSRFGKKVKKKWKKPFRALKAAARGALACVQVSTEGGEPLTEPLDAGEHQLRIQCNGVPIADARFTTVVDGGLAVISTVVRTNGEGIANLSLGKVYGRGDVSVQLEHDLSHLSGVHLLGVIEPRETSGFQVLASEPATVSLRVTGVQGEELTRTREAFQDLLERKWGAEAVQGGGQLEAILRVNIGSQVSVDQQQSQPISWRLTVQGPRGKLFERDDRAGALTVGAREARQEAMSNMIQKITRW